MRARHGNSIFQPHQFGEHFGAAHQGYPPFQSCIALGVAFLDGSRRYNDCRLAQIVGTVAYHHLDAALAKAINDIAIRNVAALHVIAKIMHDLCNA